MIPAPCTNRLIRGGWCVGSQPAILVGAWIARSVAEWSVRTARIDRQSCMRSSHAPRTRNPEARVHVRESRKTESRKTDSGTVCRKTPSAGGGNGKVDFTNGGTVRARTYTRAVTSRLYHPIPHPDPECRGNTFLQKIIK